MEIKKHKGKEYLIKYVEIDIPIDGEITDRFVYTEADPEKKIQHKLDKILDELKNE